MILADKIIEERKRLGLSQEDFAEKLSVSRQAVSKWESAQSVPDLQKIILMSELFSVSTDYLLKDEMEPERKGTSKTDTDRMVRRVSMEDANEFMSFTENGSKSVALSVLLCILCPVILILLIGLSKANRAQITETAAVAVGLAVLFIFIAVAVFLFIRYGIQNEKFEFLKKETFETAYDITELVKEKKEAFGPIFTKNLSLGVILCVLSPLPLTITTLISKNDVLIISMTALLLCIVAVGVYMIVRVAMVKSSYMILLQEAEYQKSEKQKSNALDAASSIYWCLASAGYLTWSFVTNDWKSTWIVWPAAGILFVPFITVVNHICAIMNKKNENNY